MKETSQELMVNDKWCKENRSARTNTD